METANTELTSAEASAVPERIGIARANQALTQNQFEFDVRKDAQAFHQNEQQMIMQLAGQLGSSPLAVAQSMGIDIAQPGVRQGQILAGLKGDANFAEANREQIATQVFANLGFSPEFETAFRDDLAENKTPEEMVSRLRANTKLDDETRFRGFLAIQLMHPGFAIPDEVKDVKWFQFLREFFTQPGIVEGFSGRVGPRPSR